MMNTTTFSPAPAAAALCIAVVALALQACGARAADDKKTMKPALTVSTTQPRQTTLSETLAANGNIAAWQEASIGAETGGLRLTEVRANVGDRVQKGQVLATFAAETVGAEAAQARASLGEAEASAANAAADAERARSLQATGALSASQINQYLTAEKTTRARVDAARALLRVQQVRLGQTQVRAPDSGIISARLATVGAVVGSGAELFRLIRQGRLEWRAEVTSVELGRLTTGTTALVTAASGAKLVGRVRTIGPTVDPQTRAALVYVDLMALPGAASGSARAGMFARGEFDLGATPAVTVPQPAVVVRDGFSYVYRVNADNRVTQLKVQAGRFQQGRVEILSGLPADARIVADGAGFLNDGDLVRVATPAAPRQDPP